MYNIKYATQLTKQKKLPQKLSLNNHYHRVYYELTINHLMWLDSPVDRALYRYRKDMGSNPIQA